MSVYLIAEIKVTDDSWIPAYAEHVHPVVDKHGGRYLSRSGNIDTLEGAGNDASVIAILEFPDRASLDGFVNDPEYAPHGKARQDGSESRFRVIDDTDLVGSIPYLTAG